MNVWKDAPEKHAVENIRKDWLKWNACKRNEQMSWDERIKGPPKWLEEIEKEEGIRDEEERD